MPSLSAQQRLQSLLEMTHLLLCTVEPDEVLTVVLTSALRLFDAEGCSLALLDPPPRNWRLWLWLDQHKHRPSASPQRKALPAG